MLKSGVDITSLWRIHCRWLCTGWVGHSVEFL